MRYLEENPIIKTGENPSSKVFEEIIFSIGLDFSKYEMKRNYIDSGLLSNRHKIVHGEKNYISIEDFDETLNNVLDIMDIYKEQIFMAAYNKKYLKTS